VKIEIYVEALPLCEREGCTATATKGGPCREFGSGGAWCDEHASFRAKDLSCAAAVRALRELELAGKS